MVIFIDLRLFEYCELTVLTILVTYRLMTWASLAASSHVIFVQIKLFKYIPCTSYWFLVWLNICGHLNHWEATPFCTIPLPTRESVCFRNLSHTVCLASTKFFLIFVFCVWKGIFLKGMGEKHSLCKEELLTPAGSKVMAINVNHQYPHF